MADPITVRVLKYDGSEYRRWQANLSRRNGSLLVLDAEFEGEVTHEALGSIPKGMRTKEYYWLDRWYNIFEFLKDDGSTRIFYCNISTPALYEAGVLTYVDLDVDILVTPELSYRVMDLDEFDENARRYGYSAETRSMADAALNDLKQMIEDRQFPFANELGVSK
jgi:protein associated with RNAse G/E